MVLHLIKGWIWISFMNITTLVSHFFFFPLLWRTCDFCPFFPLFYFISLVADFGTEWMVKTIIKPTIPAMAKKNSASFPKGAPYFFNPCTMGTSSEEDIRLGWLWDQLPLTALLASLGAVQRKLEITKAQRLSWPASAKSLTLTRPASNSMREPLIKLEQRHPSSLTVNI